MAAKEVFWLALGFVAQMLFGLRFVIQWVQSERRGRSIVPVSFWYLSLAGAALMLAYSIYRRDPVFILGQLMGMAVYLGNLRLIHRAPPAVD